MKELLRKTFRLDLELKDGRAVNFQIKQGTFRELLLMSKAIESGITLKQWLVDFLIANQQGDVKITPADFEFLMPHRVAEIVDWLTKTYAKGFFTTKKAAKSEEEARTKAPDSSIICFVLMDTNETVESLLDLTWEQVEYLIEGCLWNRNGQTKEGQKRNERTLRAKLVRQDWDDNRAADLLKRMEARHAKGEVKFKPMKWKPKTR